MIKRRERLRILCIGETWFGSDAEAAFSALRRAGHSIHVLDEAHFVPTEWRRTPGRVLRKLFRGTMVNELTQRAVDALSLMQPDVLFVFKGNYVSPEILDAARSRGVLSVNYFPDVSFLAHGPQLPRALPRYDHVFNAKRFGVTDMLGAGVPSVSFLPPGFNPQLHRPVELSGDDIRRFGCDVSFIGTWSPAKEAIMTRVREAAPRLSIRVWGYQWERRRSRVLDDVVMGTGIIGEDYARAICASHLCLGLLSEARLGSSSGDLITARTFQIPACGAFMLHERNTEVAEYFREGVEAEFWSDAEELVSKITRYLESPEKRRQIALAGYSRSIASDYSIDRRMSEVVNWIVARPA